MAALRSRLTYANVVATLALVLALSGGVVWAAGKINSGDIARNAIKSKHIKNHQVKTKDLAVHSVGTDQLKGGSVGTDQLQPDAVGSAQIADGSVAFGDLAANTVSPRLFAHVSSGGTLGESAGVDSAYRQDKGTYFVYFDQSLKGCVGVASVGFGFGPGVIGAGADAQVRMNADGEPEKVRVTTYNGFTLNDTQDNDFSLIVEC